MKTVVLLAFVAGVGVAAYLYTSQNSWDTTDGSVPLGEVMPAGRSDDIPREAPPFARHTIEGDRLELASLKGRVVVLNFWATWCAPCRAEIPSFVQIQAERGKEGVQFVGVSLDQEGASVVRPFAREFGINYPIVLDDGTLAEQYGGHYALPTTFFIDRSGIIRQRIVGGVDETALVPIIDALLSES